MPAVKKGGSISRIFFGKGKKGEPPAAAPEQPPSVVAGKGGAPTASTVQPPSQAPQPPTLPPSAAAKADSPAASPAPAGVTDTAPAELAATAPAAAADAAQAMSPDASAPPPEAQPPELPAPASAEEMASDAVDPAPNEPEAGATEGTDAAPAPPDDAAPPPAVAADIVPEAVEPLPSVEDAPKGGAYESASEPVSETPTSAIAAEAEVAATTETDAAPACAPDTVAAAAAPDAEHASADTHKEIPTASENVAAQDAEGHKGLESGEAAQTPMTTQETEESAAAVATSATVEAAAPPEEAQPASVPELEPAPVPDSEVAAAPPPAKESPDSDAGPHCAAPAAEEPAAPAQGAVSTEEADITPLPANWERVTAEDGRVFFWNSATDEVSWEHPAEKTPTSTAPGQSEGLMATKSASSLRNEFEKKAASNVSEKVELQRKTSQHAMAMRALERKQAQAEKTPGSQHASALKSLEAASSRTNAAKGASQHELAMRSLKGKFNSSDEVKSENSGGAPAWEAARSKPENGGQFSEAKAAFLQKANQEQDSAPKGSQRQEAMRKLNAKGVVPTKQAFQVQAKKDSQMSQAMDAFSKNGADMSVGGPKRKDLMGKPVAAPARKSDASSQRSAALAALQGKISS